MEQAPAAPKRRLLVIDDEEPIRFALSDYFRTLGYDVDCAHEREEAEALLAHKRYAAVIADLRLTGIHGAEGLEIVAFVRQRCPQTRIVLLTAFGTPEVKREALRLGVDSFLSKPKALGQLAQILIGLLEAP